MHSLLILEDDVSLSDTLAAILSHKFKIYQAPSLKEASKQLSQSQVDAVLSDFVLSDGNGFDVINLVQRLTPRPKLLFMTAYAEKDMAIKLLNEKIDGLLEKPFAFTCLMKLLERELTSEAQASTTSFSLNPFEKLFVMGTLSVELTDTEFKILSFLISQKNRWISRDDLITHVWGDSVTSRNTLDTHLTNIKRKVPLFKENLKVVRSRGFCFTPPAF